MKITEILKGEIYHIEYKYPLCENLFEIIKYTKKYNVLQCKILEETEDFLCIENYCGDDVQSNKNNVLKAIINKKYIISIIVLR